MFFNISNIYICTFQLQGKIIKKFKRRKEKEVDINGMVCSLRFYLCKLSANMGTNTKRSQVQGNSEY